MAMDLCRKLFGSSRSRPSKAKPVAPDAQLGIVLDVLPQHIVIYTDQDRMLRRVKISEVNRLLGQDLDLDLDLDIIDFDSSGIEGLINTLVWIQPDPDQRSGILHLTTQKGFSPVLCTTCRYRTGCELVSGRCEICTSDQEIGDMTKCNSCAVKSNSCTLCSAPLSCKIVPYNAQQDWIDGHETRVKRYAMYQRLKELKA